MRIFLLNCFLLLTFSFQAYGQAGKSFKYQTVVRNSAGAVESNKIVSIRFSILKASDAGITVFSERHTKATNEFGILNVNIGEGTLITGTNLSSINWAEDKHFLKIDLDINGGNNYQFMGTSELFSVPYAIYADKAGTSLDDNDKSPTNELQNITLSNNTITLSQDGGSVNLEPYLDNTDNQTINLQGNTLSISGGNSIVLSGAVDLDTDPTNELQNLSLNGNTLSISQGNSVNFPPNLDNNPTNEIQNLSINGTQISISQGNSINIPANLDNSPTNEIQFLSIQNDSLFLSQGNGIPLNQLTSSPGNDPNSPGTITNAQLGGNYSFIRKLGVDNSPSYPFGDKYDNEPFDIDSQGNFIVVHSITSSNPTFMIGNNTFNNPSSTVFVAKYTSAGNLIWQKNYSSPGIRFFSVKVDNNNAIIVFGRSGSSNVLIEGQNINASRNFILKYNSSGSFVFVHEVPQPAFFNLNKSFCIDASGNIYYAYKTPSDQTTVIRLNSLGNQTGTCNVNKNFDFFVHAEFDNQGNYYVSGRNNNDSRASIIKVNFATGVIIFDFNDMSDAPRFGCKFEIESSGNVHFYTRRSNDNNAFNYFKLSQNGSLLIQRQSSESTPPPIDLLITNNQLYFSIDQETNFFGEAQINSYNTTTASTNNNAHNIRLNINGEFQSVRSLKSLSNIHGFYLKSYNSQLYKMFIAYGSFYNNGIQYEKGIYIIR